jgi:hypothetical protein
MTDNADPAEQAVAHLAAVAGMPLPPERIVALAPQFTAWLDGARELCEKMNSPQHLEVTPITTLSHPTNPTGE